MKNYFLIAITFLALILSSCKEEVGEGTLNLKFNARINSSDLQFNQYYDMDGDSVRFEIFKFYISDFSLMDKDATQTIEVVEVALVDFQDEGSTTISKTLEVNSYKNPSFLIGLSNARNETDPSSYASAHPLSLDQGNYWLMANSYIFFKIEGFRTKNGVETPFVFHVGGNDMFGAINLERSLSINKGNTSTLVGNIDINSLFSNIDFDIENQTHSPNPLAFKLMANFVNSLSVN